MSTVDESCPHPNNLNEFQMKAASVLWHESFSSTPAVDLNVKDSDHNVTDFLIPETFVDACGSLEYMKCFNLRKSLEQTFMTHLRSSAHWNNINNDSREAPRYFVHGWTEPWDPSASEVWAAHASIGVWASLYCWTGQLGQLPQNAYTTSIKLETCPEVLGYIYLLEISNSEFHSSGRIACFESAGSPHAPDHTSETTGKILARYGYAASQPLLKETLLAVVPEPDAYIFKGDVLQFAQLNIVHTYRMIKPALSEEKQTAIKRHLEEETKQAEEEQKEAQRAAEELEQEQRRRQLNPCGCRHSSNIYHTCVAACACKCV